MKNIQLLFVFILVLHYSSIFSQNWNLTGEWTGYVTQKEGIRNIYYCKLNLEQFGNQIKGGSYFDFFDEKDVFVTFTLEGSLKGNEFNYQEIKVLNDYIPPKYSQSITGWCIKKANLKISETNDSLKLIGSWTGVPNTGQGYCYPGGFYVTKPKIKPITKVENNPQNAVNSNIQFELPKEVHKGDKYIIPNINFKPSTTELLPESYPSLDKLAGYLKSRPELKITIVGHTDIGKDDTYNQTLSKGRADAVKSYLLKQNIHTSRISTEGKGNKQPIASNETTEGRAKNRRVEIIIKE